MAGEQVWFVTGASRGFGREIVEQALERGYRVVATARDPATLADLADERLLALPLDVTEAGQIGEAVTQAEAHFGAIDVLVNNAGYGYLAAVEEGEDDEIRALFNANVFGLAALIRAVLPGQRARGRGTIVNISSAGGFAGFPGSGYYAASKFAVEGLSESLAKELAPLGLRVLLVEPGPFRTDWAGSSLRQSPIHIEAYEPTAGIRRRTVHATSGTQAGCPARAAATIIDAVEDANPPFRLPLGESAADTILRELDSVAADIAPWLARARAADVPLLEEVPA
jgi:NAD(P)-dependent dehydrogenase (short-subunit alcohol dehydrogenase family)